jgi:ketosteroid isomerase-like protein
MDEDEKVIAATYERWGRAVAARDVAGLEDIFDPSYSYTSTDGRRIERPGMLEREMNIPAPQLPLNTFAPQRVTEDVIIVRGSHGLKGEYPPGYVREEIRELVREGVEMAFTSVWRRTDGTWKVVSNDAHVVRA